MEKEAEMIGGLNIVFSTNFMDFKRSFCIGCTSLSKQDMV